MSLATEGEGLRRCLLYSTYDQFWLIDALNFHAAKHIDMARE